MCSDPLYPGGDVRGCTVVDTLGMLDVHHFRGPAAFGCPCGVSRAWKMHFKHVHFVCSWISGNFPVVGREK